MPAAARSISTIPTTLAAWFAGAVDAAALAAHVTRVAVVVAAPARRAAVPIFTYRRAGREGVQPYWMLDAAAPDAFSAAGFTEDVTFRGLHPMIARRLQMWRLSNFEITRLGSPDEVFVFDCVARDQPAPTSVSSPWPRSATSRRSATTTAGRWPCRRWRRVLSAAWRRIRRDLRRAPRRRAASSGTG